jgi:hypothetical protein
LASKVASYSPKKPVIVKFFQYLPQNNTFSHFLHILWKYFFIHQ